jgi:hypothetical protein
MPRPEFDIAVLGKITSYLEDKGNDVYTMQHLNNNMFQIETEDKKGNVELGIYQLQGDKVVRCDLKQ